MSQKPLNTEILPESREADFCLAEPAVESEALDLVGILSSVASVEGANPVSPQDLLRMSICIEHPDDLFEDLRQALA